MAGLNRMILSGTITKDPELRYVSEDKPIARFIIKVESLNKETNFFNCVASGALAQTCMEYIKKGSVVAAEGKLSTKPYISKGIKKQYTEVIVDNLLMLDKKFKFSKGK